MKTELLIAILSSSAFNALVVYIINTITNKKRDKNGVKEGVQILLRNSIESEAKRYIEEGSITFDNYRRLEEEHSCYKALGGNGWLSLIMEELEKLPKKGRLGNLIS